MNSTDMQVGFLYMNDGKYSLLQKVQEAVAAFNKKYGRNPEYCLVNPTDAKDQDLNEMAKSLNVLVQAHKFVLPFHFWVGFEGMELTAQ